MCPRDYRSVLLKYVDPENLPEYLGGTSKHTLLDDAGPWHDPKIRAAVEADRRRLGHGRQGSDAGSQLEGAALSRGALEEAKSPARARQEPPSPVVRRA